MDKATAPSKGAATKGGALNGRTLTVGALVMMNVVAVVSLRGLPAEAEYGLSSIFYYVFAAIFFLVPVALVAAEMATGWPEKGGVFRWVGEAFGPRIALVAMFMLFLEVTIWFPTGLTFGAVSLAYTDPNMTLDEKVSGNPIFVLAVVLAVYWAATFIAMRGTKSFSKVAKWGGIVGTIIPAIILIVLGFSYVFAGNAPKINVSWGELIPDFSKFSNVVLAASIFLFYAGMEMNAIHVKEVKNPNRNYPLGVLTAAAATVIIFVLGTLAIAFVVPKADINLTQSLLVAYKDMFVWAHIGWAAPIVAAMLVFGVLAGIVTWVAGPSSGLLVVANAGYLPRFFQKTNKYGMASNILWVQAFSVTALSVVFVILPSVQAAYQILSQLTVILYLVMYLLMFAAGIRLRITQPNRPRPFQVPGGKWGMFIFGGLGFVGSALAFSLSFIPPDQITVGSPALYVGILVVLAVISIAIPFIVYAVRKPQWHNPKSDFAPFTWEVENMKPSAHNPSTRPAGELTDMAEEGHVPNHRHKDLLGTHQAHNATPVAGNGQPDAPHQGGSR